ncbi:MAG: flagellar hook-associated protein FlgK [Clostridia bacterium]|nr:flagellar hook-associated protein FlgK [Clostridia bacterium]
MLEFSRAVSALRVSEQNLFVTGNNLSNVNTEGYKRQQLVQREFPSIDMGNYTVGLGVDADTVRQIKSEMLERNYRNELASFGEYEIEEKIYTDLQTLVGDPSVEVVQGALSEFFTAANDITKNYSNAISRNYLRENAVAFLSELNNIEEQLTKMQTELNNDIKETVKTINDYAEKIADLNVQITRYEAGGTKANNLRDARDLAIEELSKLVEIEVEDFTNTSVNIRCGNGFLVINGESSKLTTIQNVNESVFCYPAWEKTGVQLQVKSGELKGLLDMRGGSVTGNLLHSSNGSPKEKADIVISIDPNLSQEKIDMMKNSIDTMIATLDNQSANYQFYLSNGTAVTADELKDYIANLTAGAGDYDVLGSTDDLAAIQYRNDSAKYLFAFTESELNATPEEVKAAVGDFNKLDMRTIIVTTEDDVVRNSWKKLAEGTEGSIYIIDDLATEEGAEKMALTLSRDFNSRLDETGNEDGIPNVRSGLNAIVNAMAKEINAIFRKGTNAYGQKNGDIDPDTGETICLDLFVKENENLPLQMGNIKVNPLFADVNNMPLSLSGDEGDTKIGEMLVALRDENVFSCGDEFSSIEEQYANFILTLGERANKAITGYESQETIVNNANERRLAVSGVSMDEELSNMLKFQYAYTGASKLINVISEMLETIVNL